MLGFVFAPRSNRRWSTFFLAVNWWPRIIWADGGCPDNWQLGRHTTVNKSKLLSSDLWPDHHHCTGWQFYWGEQLNTMIGFGPSWTNQWWTLWTLWKVEPINADGEDEKLITADDGRASSVGGADIIWVEAIIDYSLPAQCPITWQPCTTTYTALHWYELHCTEVILPWSLRRNAWSWTTKLSTWHDRKILRTALCKCAHTPLCISQPGFFKVLTPSFKEEE